MMMKKVIASLSLGILFASSFVNEANASVKHSIYTDLSMNNTFYEAVYSMNMKEVLEAEYTNDGKVLIDAAGIVTRGEAAYMLYMLLGMEPEISKSFPDVKSDSAYYEAISTIASLGYVNGYEDGSFRPDVELTRSQMTRILSGAFNYSVKTNVTVPFTDVNERWAPYVDAIFRNGVTKGVTATSFAPDKKLTRGEMSAFMYRAFKKVPGSTYNDFEVMNAVNEATRKTRIIMIQGLEKYHPNHKAADIKDDLSELVVEPYLLQALKEYEASCYNCDNANVIHDFQFGLPFRVVSKTDNVLKVDATVPSNGINSGYRATIELVRSGDTWKIKTYVPRTFKEDPLKLTIEQSIDYLKYAIPLYYQEEVDSIQHTGKEPRLGLDLFKVNGKTTYVFDVNTAELTEYYPVN